MKRILFTALALLAGAGLAQAAPTGARIAQGAVRGVEADGVVSFKGLPFAAPPVGALRWRAPRPPAAWSGIRSADAFGPVCIQSLKLPGMGGRQSEDCLTLNIYAPAGPTAKLPVMVWIHGGGFVFGSGSHYDATRLARRGVMVVTINYRLGRFGFFAHPALLGEGDGANFGLEDQIAALRWVRANIAAFGGDPANITAFGESAGAVSINHLLVSPRAKGLFDKAIVESGFARVAAKSLDTASAAGTAFAKDAGVSGDGPSAAAALRALPADAVAKPVNGLLDPGAPNPIVDGKTVTETVASAFAAGREAPAPLMIGGNSYEVSLFPQWVAQPETILSRYGALRPMIVGLYGAGDPKVAVATMMTQAMIIEPDRFQARRQAAIGKSAWLYYFSYVPAAMRAEVPGAGHGAELAYVFGTLPETAHEMAADDPRPGPRHIPAATPQDRAISDAMQDYWSNFAKTGSPGSAGGPEWPRAGPDGNTVMEFGADGPVVRPTFKVRQLDPLTTQAEAHGDVLRGF